MAVDATGNVYIGEFGGCRIRKAGTDGKISTFAGTGGCGDSGDGGVATAAKLGAVRNLIFDAAGNLYLSDWSSHKVRRITPDGVISTFAGAGVAGYSGDGGPATAAALNQPSGLSIGSDGTVFIADAGNNRIRAVLPSTATLSISANQLSFTASSGGGLTPQQNITLNASLGGVAFNGLPFSATSDAPWLVVTPNTGSSPATIGISVDPANLPAGSSQGVIRISAPGANPGQVAINVSASVAAPNPPKLTVDTTQLSFSTQKGASNPLRVVLISNTGGGALSVNASPTTAKGGDWLIASASGQVTPGKPLALSVTVDTANLSPDTYTGKVLITSDQGQAEVSVSMVVVRRRRRCCFRRRG